MDKKILLCLSFVLIASCSYMDGIIPSEEADTGVTYSYMDTHQDGYNVENDQDLSGTDMLESEAVKGIKADEVIIYDEDVVRKEDKEDKIAVKAEIEQIAAHKVIEVEKNDISNEEVVKLSENIKEPARPNLEENIVLTKPKNIFVTDDSFVTPKKEEMKFDFSSNEKEIKLIQPLANNSYDLSGYFMEDANGESVSYAIATIYHPDGKNSFNSKYDASLKKVVSIVNQYGGRVKIVGHASSRTRNMDLATHNLINLDISYKRAQNVADRLMELGLSSKLIKITAVADKDPIYAEIMPMGETKNRRTELFIEQ